MPRSPMNVQESVGRSAVENEYDGPSVRLLFEAAEVVHASVPGSLRCADDEPPEG
jgi:hypothetical protein